MPIAEAIPLTFSESLLAFAEGIACEQSGLAFSAPMIPLPEIDDYIIVATSLSHHAGSISSSAAPSYLRMLRLPAALVASTLLNLHELNSIRLPRLCTDACRIRGSPQNQFLPAGREAIGSLAASCFMYPPQTSAAHQTPGATRSSS